MNFIIKSSVEKLLTKQINAITSNLVSFGEIDLVKYDMEYVSLLDILEDANTFPMWSDYKVIVCNNANFLTAKGIKNSDFENDYDLLETYIDNPSSFTSIIFVVEEKFDKRKKVVKHLEKSCKIFDLDHVDTAKIVDMVVNKLNKENKHITVENANYMCARLNNNLSLIFNELEKVCLVNEIEIDKEVIDKLVSRTLEDNIFELTTSVVNLDIDKSYKIYKDLVMQKEEPIAMIAMLANQFRLILQVNTYLSRGLSRKDIASKLKVHPYRVEVAAKSNYTLSSETLSIFINELCEIDYKIKTGVLDKYLGFELFILSLNKSRSTM